MNCIEYILSKEDLELINEIEESSDDKKENNINSNRIKKEYADGGSSQKTNINNSNASDRTQVPTKTFENDSKKSIKKLQRDEISKFEPLISTKTEISMKNNKPSQKIAMNENNINQVIGQSFEKVKIFEPGFKHPTKEGVKCRRIYGIIPDLSNLPLK